MTSKLVAYKVDKWISIELLSVIKIIFTFVCGCYRMIKLEEKIKESETGRNVMSSPEGTTFEYSVLQIVIPADFIN